MKTPLLNDWHYEVRALGIVAAPSVAVAQDAPADPMKLKVAIDLPDGDTRKVKVMWRAMHEGVLCLCVKVVDAAPSLPAVVPQVLTPQQNLAIRRAIIAQDGSDCDDTAFDLRVVLAELVGEKAAP